MKSPILIYLCLVLLSTMLFSYDLESVLKTGQIQLKGDSIPVVADDGTVFHIQETVLTDGSYQGLTHGPRFTNPSMYYLLCCDKKHVVFSFEQNSGYFSQENDHILTITKYKDFEYFTAYNFVFKYRNLFNREKVLNQIRTFNTEDEETISKVLDYTEKNGYSYSIGMQLIIDKKDGIYCTFSYRSAPFNKLFSENITLETEELYKVIADYYWDLITTKIEEHEAQMLGYVYNTIESDMDMYTALDVIKKYEPEKGIALATKIDKLKELEEETKDIRETKRLLVTYTTPVFLAKPGIGVPKRPGIKGDLPTTDEELWKYLEWIKSVYEKTRRDGYLQDEFGTDIKFELAEEGIQAISAGPDKKFNTEDDINCLRKYDDTYKIIIHFI